MIKVIASDMDGTLLGLDHKVAPRTLEAIHSAQEQGIRFMIATGRNFRSAMEELEELDLKWRRSEKSAKRSGAANTDSD